jgi:Gpi18-like mannosyltransferase
MNATDVPPPHRFMFRTRRLSVLVGVAVLALALLTLRVLLWRLGNHNFDMRGAYLVWQAYLIEHGRWHALRRPVGMYFPAYYELTTLTSYLDGHFSRVTQIKVISFCFDIFAAVVAYLLAGRLTRRGGSEGPSTAQLVAPFTILAGPTIILNGAVWGQCDIVFTSFLLLSVWAIIADKDALATLSFGFSLAFKLQAVFLAPFLFAMVLGRRVRWQYLLLVPVGWIIALIPPVLNGARVWDYLLQPGSQAGAFPVLAIDIGNPWAVLQAAGLSERIGLPIGLVVTVVLFFVLGLWGAKSRFSSATNTLALAAFGAQAMPYFMPKMGNRYFLPAEVLLCVLSCVDFAFALPAGLVILASLLAYGEYFAPFARHFVLFVALLANTSALWLVFQRIRLRTRPEALGDHRTHDPSVMAGIY